MCALAAVLPLVAPNETPARGFLIAAFGMNPNPAAPDRCCSSQNGASLEAPFYVLSKARRVLYTA